MTETDLIQELIERASKLPHRDAKELDSLQRRAEMVIRRVFGESSTYMGDLKKIAFYPNFYPVSEQQYNELWKSAQNKMVNLFNTILEELGLFGVSSQASTVNKAITSDSNRIFIVHGHDEAMKQGVARTLEKIGLQPIILHEQPNKGRTIIEKFTEYSDVGFTVVLLSADDMAYSKGQPSAKAIPRARQNVIFELGFFLGKLGREHVFTLYKSENNFELPSDYSGVLYTPFDDVGQWRFELVKELKAAGYDVDANKLV